MKICNGVSACSTNIIEYVKHIDFNLSLFTICLFRVTEPENQKVLRATFITSLMKFGIIL